MVVPAGIGETVDAANGEAVKRILAGNPVLSDVQLAGDVLDGFGDRTILHAGPPITWERMCEPMKGAALAACVFE